MPLLARTILTPLVIEVSPGALGRLDTVIADSRISAGGRVAVVQSAAQRLSDAHPAEALVSDVRPRGTEHGDRQGLRVPEGPLCGHVRG